MSKIVEDLKAKFPTLLATELLTLKDICTKNNLSADDVEVVNVKGKNQITLKGSIKK